MSGDEEFAIEQALRNIELQESMQLLDEQNQEVDKSIEDDMLPK